MKTANQKASEITGHQPACDLRRDRPMAERVGNPACTCEHPLAVQVAAAQGTLSPRHQFDDLISLHEPDICLSCGAEGRQPTACFPPLDPAKAWALLVLMAPVIGERRLFDVRV
jgi:hypothetical protein